MRGLCHFDAVSHVTDTKINPASRAYKGLSPRTRALFGLGLMGWAGIGLMLSPVVEERMGIVPSQEEQEELDRKLRLKIHTVDKED